jgi:hypothetical protein
MDGDANAFVSTFAALPGEAFMQTAKLYFLWYDHLILEEMRSLVIGDRTVPDAELWSRAKSRIIGNESLTIQEQLRFDEVVVPLSSIVNGAIARTRLERAGEGYPRWNDGDTIMYSYPEPETAHEYAHNAILAQLEADHGVVHFSGPEIEFAEGSAGAAVQNVVTWSEVNKQIGAELIPTVNEKRAISAMLEFARRNEPTVLQVDMIKDVAFVTLPDVSFLSWSELIAIKRGGEFRDVRARLIKVATEEPDAVSAVAKFNEEVERLSREIILRSKPRPLKALIEMVATNLPVGLFNPYSIFVGYKNFISQSREAASRKWVYTLKDLENGVDAKHPKLPKGAVE